MANLLGLLSAKVVLRSFTISFYSPRTVCPHQSIQSWTVVMIVVPWLLLMVGVATAVILCTCKKGECVHESKPCIFYGELIIPLL